MTITDTEPEAGATVTPAGEPGGSDFASRVGTGDHKRIGRAYLAGSLIGLVATLVTGLLLDADRITANIHDIIDKDVVVQAMSFHRFGLIFLFALPALLGLAVAVVPLQVGASTIAFGRAAALSFWGWLLGAVLWSAGFLLGGGPGGSDARGTDLWILASIMVLGSLLLGTICVVSTILGLRAKGMTLWHTPLFSVSMLVAGSVWVLTLPIAVANLLLAYIDHRYGQVLFGAEEAIAGQIAWLATQPQVYAFAVPVLGIAAEQVPVFARVRQSNTRFVILAIAASGALSIGAWAQPGLVAELYDEPFFIGFGILAVLPVLMILALFLDTIEEGELRPSGPLVLALGSVGILLAATATGLAHFVEPLGLVATTWTTGQFELALLSVVAGVFAGLWYWASKILGRELPEGVGKGLGAVLLLGSLLATVPLLVAGALDQPDAVPPGLVRDGVETLNIVATAGTAVVLLAVVGLIATMLLALRKPAGAPENPWGGHTLEWATASPPPVGNFAAAPEVSDDRPLFVDQLEEASE